MPRPLTTLAHRYRLPPAPGPLVANGRPPKGKGKRMMWICWRIFHWTWKAPRAPSYHLWRIIIPTGWQEVHRWSETAQGASLSVQSKLLLVLLWMAGTATLSVTFRRGINVGCPCHARCPSRSPTVEMIWAKSLKPLRAKHLLWTGSEIFGFICWQANEVEWWNFRSSLLGDGCKCTIAGKP